MLTGFIVAIISQCRLTLEQHVFELYGPTYRHFIFSSLPYWKNTPCNTHNTQNTVRRFFMVSVRLPVNSRLLVVKFWENQKLYADFRLHGLVLEAVSASPTLALFKGQLYIYKYMSVKIV